MKTINNFLSGVPMTMAAGVCLIFSIIFMVTDFPFPFDPAWIAILLSGIPMLYLALTRLFYEKWISSALLISIAMIASMVIGEIFAAGEVAFIMAIGAILEDMTVARAKKGLSKLIALTPTKARKLTKNKDIWIEEMVPIEHIKTGDVLRVLPGENIPVDGKIKSGNTSVDQSIITGESIPVDKNIGEDVFCGTINCYGSIDIEASKVGEDSSLQKLIALVKEAENKKAPMQRTADQWAVWLVPIALLIAISAFFINWGLGYPVMTALNRCVTVLVVFCPCALALATPVSIMAAIGQASKHGIIIKSGEALEKMGKVDTIAFDKTIRKNMLLSITASAEYKSEHPLGKAIVEYAKQNKIRLRESSSFQMTAGKGVRAIVESKHLLCGNEKYLLENHVMISDIAANELKKFQSQGKASIFIASDGKCIGIIALSDVLRESAGDIIHQLSEMDTKTVLLTGDHKMTADYFAEKAGITEVHADLLPEQKVESIVKLQQEGKVVCMIGDGINDAPALKTADVGAAMGSMGSDIAIEAADIALMSDDISKIPYLKRLSHSTLNTIKGNITASMCINAVAVTLSVLGLLNPVTGALVHNAGSVLVVLNAALLYDRNFE